MDNLPPKTNAEIEQEQAALFDAWSRRERLLALRALYVLCDSYIADLPWKISMALAMEIEKKKRGLIG
jgi:hypothetical protein